LRADNSIQILYRAAFQEIDMQSAKRMQSIKSKKRELRGAQRESREKVEKLKGVSHIHPPSQPFISVSPGVKNT
jgi:hypothetical protein